MERAYSLLVWHTLSHKRKGVWGDPGRHRLFVFLTGSLYQCQPGSVSLSVVQVIGAGELTHTILHPTRTLLWWCCPVQIRIAPQILCRPATDRRERLRAPYFFRGTNTNLPALAFVESISCRDVIVINGGGQADESYETPRARRNATSLRAPGCRQTQVAPR